MSRLAWFRATPPDPADPLDETAPVIDALRARHHLDIVTEADAHGFVWRDFRQPYDVYVYEPAGTPAHRFMRAYAAHYPGIVAPRGLGVRDISRHKAQGSRLKGQLLIGEVGRYTETAGRAVARAVAAGAAVEMVRGAPGDVLAQADVIVALEWPPAAGPPTAALLGMAAGRPVIVFEIEATAAWPALDPQTWQPRDPAGWLPASAARPPIVVSIDPRDEEHSLTVALVRLAADARLRASLAEAAHAWWRAHATLEHAVQAWEQILAEAAARPRVQTQAADHSAGTRDLLEPFGVTVDFLHEARVTIHDSQA